MRTRQGRPAPGTPLPLGYSYSNWGWLFTVEEVDPQAARRLLETDHHANNPVVVAHYADLMRAGKWRPITQPPFGQPHCAIVLSAAGCIENGHHRLAAVVASGLSQRFVVMRRERRRRDA